MMFSMSFSIGEVILLPIPFTDLSSRKVRPAIVIGHSSFAGDLFVVPISSQLQNVDVALLEWRAAGLNVACGIKSQLAAVESRLVIKAIGVLSPRDRASCTNRLRAWLEL
jgi:mRNA interferase MazF